MFHPASCSMNTVVLSWGVKWQLTTRLHLVTFHAFMAWTGTTLPLSFTTLHRQVHCKHFPNSKRIFSIVFFPGSTQSWDSLFITPKQCFSCMGGYLITEPRGCTRYSGNEKCKDECHKQWLDGPAQFIPLTVRQLGLDANKLQHLWSTTCIQNNYWGHKLFPHESIRV
jgi:hypothetical protein